MTREERKVGQKKEETLLSKLVSAWDVPNDTEDMLYVEDVKKALLLDSKNIQEAMDDVVKHLMDKGIDRQIVMDVSVRLAAYIVCSREDVFGDFEDE